MAALSVILAIGANALYDRFDIGPTWLLSAPTVAAAFAILYGFFDQTLWRFSFFHLVRIVDTPVIRGNYEGILGSSYNNLQLRVRIEIEQTWTKLVVRFQVLSPRSSESISMSAILRQYGARQARLTYCYRSTVRPGVAAADMNDHDGTAEVAIDLQSGTLSGRYYNYRGRQGTLDLQKV